MKKILTIAVLTACTKERYGTGVDRSAPWVKDGHVLP